MTIETQPTPLCPLTMIGSGRASKCVRYYDGNSCQHCPLESLDRIAAGLHDLVSVLNITENIGIDTDTNDGLFAVADAIGKITARLEQ